MSRFIFCSSLLFFLCSMMAADDTKVPSNGSPSGDNTLFIVFIILLVFCLLYGLCCCVFCCLYFCYRSTNSGRANADSRAQSGGKNQPKVRSGGQGMGKEQPKGSQPVAAAGVQGKTQPPPSPAPIGLSQVGMESAAPLPAAGQTTYDQTAVETSAGPYVGVSSSFEPFEESDAPQSTWRGEKPSVMVPHSTNAAAGKGKKKHSKVSKSKGKLSAKPSTTTKKTAKNSKTTAKHSQSTTAKEKKSKPSKFKQNQQQAKKNPAKKTPSPVVLRKLSKKTTQLSKTEAKSRKPTKSKTSKKKKK